MKTLHCTVWVAVVFLSMATDSYSADIRWSLYLRSTMSQGPILSRTTQEGKEFTLGDFVLTGSHSSYRGLLSDFEGTTFLLQQPPSAQTSEIRLILNCASSAFDKPARLPHF